IGMPPIVTNYSHKIIKGQGVMGAKLQNATSDSDISCPPRNVNYPPVTAYLQTRKLNSLAFNKISELCR
ncbi:TPA: hypothetical protein ACWV7H_004964, partial [Salmonella enterica subsp. enterica serovar Muenchen]